MRVVVMGTPEFALPSLRALAAEHDVVAVYTRPDTPRGRGRTLAASPVAVEAVDLGLPVVKVASFADDRTVESLRGLAPDVVCVVAFGLILPREVLEIPRLGCVNVHASLLPRWRGAAPIERAILCGDESTGVSIMRMDEGLDTGPVALQVRVQVGEADAATLTDLLAREGARALLDVLAAMGAGTAVWTPQADEGATYAAKVSAEDVALAPSLSAREVIRRVRASSKRAPSRAVIAGCDVKVLAAAPSDHRVSPGRVSTPGGTLVIGAADGAVELLRVLPSGRGAMACTEFVRGARMGDDAEWSAR